MFQRRKRRAGFTLLELIIVIIVIGILASIALPRYIRIAEKGRAAEAKNILSAIRSAQMRYAAQHAVYATTIGNLDLNLPAAKYYTYVTTCATVTDLSSTTACLATATRLTTVVAENPNMGAYVLNISMGGLLDGDATGDTAL
jgi:type IV pilus assembly protein PilE